MADTTSTEVGGPAGAGRRSRWGVDRALGLSANICAIVGAAVSLRSGDGLWLLPSAAVAIYLLYAVWHRHWAAAGASAAVFLVVVGTGYLTAVGGVAPPRSSSWLAGSASATASPAAAPNPTPADPPAATSPQSTVSAPAGPGAGEQPVEMEVVLPQHAGVDVDQPDQPVALNEAGATGVFDLYHDAGPVRSDSILTPDGLFSYPGDAGVDAAGALCSNYLTDPQTRGRHDGNGLYLSTAFCFRTSSGKVAWAKVVGLRPLDNSVVLSVRVWGAAA